jgi:PAS domain S-box-containing protein
VGGDIRLSDQRSLFERGPIVVFTWRNEAGWPVEFVSPNVVEVFGYEVQDFLDGRVAYGSLVHPDDLTRVAEEVRSATERPETSFAHEPYRVTRRDGATIWIYDYTYLVRDASGAATHFIGYVFDVTSRVVAEAEKRELERRLLQAQKLESLGVLAGGVAHDFNNLLTGILGQASLARRELGEQSKKGQHFDRLSHSVLQIEQLALRAADLTQKLLAYSGKGSMAVEPVDLGALLADMASILDVVISKKATVVKALSADLPSVVGDRAQLQQVVMNLLTNASDALGDGEGTITLMTSTRTVAEPEASELGISVGNYVVFEVSDTGSGMNEEAKLRLFEPFFTTKFAGRGLGMSAVLGIVRSHRGAIRLWSEPGVGTRFSIDLPASDRRPRPARELPLASDWKGEGTILVADDQKSIRATLGLLLRSLGFESLEAPDGKRALELYQAHKSDIVLAFLDMTMPVLSGVETMKALRALDPNLPIVLSSGYSEEEATQRTRGEPAHFLQKPYRIDELERTLRSALTAKRPSQRPTGEGG